ncbi:DUF1214 domain-containing protein [Rhizobium sp. Leaf386]|uniref:DUF1214 domain-containing protein n=1 Tax=unclassified Rhizobium TaxID=2613769 RepID=UPI000B00F0C0
MSGGNRYTLRFAPGELPPVNAFWSLTLYELPSSLLSANALNRYLINSAMLPNLIKDSDGGITLHIQHETPGPTRRPTGCRPHPDHSSWPCGFTGRKRTRWTADGKRRLSIIPAEQD